MKKTILLFFILHVFNCISQENNWHKMNVPNIVYSLNPKLKGTKWGYVSQYGTKQIAPQYDEAFPFSENGLALVKMNGKYGFIDKNAKVLIDYTYDDAKSFCGSYAWVKKNGIEALIDKDEKLFLNTWFTGIENFRNGWAKVIFENDSITNQLENKFVVAYINKECKQLADTWFSGGGSFTDGHAKVSISGEYYLIDSLGFIEYRKCEECDEANPIDPNNVVAENAEFPGGEVGFVVYIADHVEYPKLARERGIQGQVFVKFAITPCGKVVNATIVHEVHPLIDEAALKVIGALPDWKPGRKDGKPICSWYTIPINFQIK